jgi:hypothetical protein
MPRSPSGSNAGQMGKVHPGWHDAVPPGTAVPSGSQPQQMEVPMALGTRTFMALVSCVSLGAGVAACAHPDEQVAAAPPAATARSGDISIPGAGIFPESITADRDGTLYIGSMGRGEVYRVAPGSTQAEPFIARGADGITNVLGVFADDPAATLWVCSTTVGGGPPGGKTGPSALHAFDLASGAPRRSYPLADGGFCNDAAVAANGDLFVTDSNGMQVLRLRKGAAALEPWSPAGALGPTGGVLDGVAIVGGRVIAGTLLTSKLFAIEVRADGSAGTVTELQLSAPLTQPDGIRAWEAELLATDGTGRIQRVSIMGDKATVTTVKDGLEGVVSVAASGRTGYALEGQLNVMMARPGTTPPAEKPFRAVAFALP